MTPFQKRLFARWRNSFFRNKPGRPDYHLANADVVRIRKLSNAVKYMIDTDITDFEKLEKKWAALQKEKKALRSQRDALTTKLYQRTPLRELTRYEKLMRQGKGEPSSDEAGEMASLFLKIEKAMSIEKARELKNELKEQLRSIRERILSGEEKDLKERERSLKDFRKYGSGIEYLLDDAHETRESRKCCR